MSQFRTTADILDETLTKAGEPTNGNSPFESTALTYLNKMHHFIICGGNTFNLEVDEAWVWARSKQPITFELLPAYVSGSIQATAGALGISFTTASAVSLEGWHIRATNKSTVYKITNHTASSTVAQLDSVFLDDTGTYGYKAFKLDYEVFPNYMYVDSSNDRLDYQETAVSTLSATLTHGAYSQSAYLTHILARLVATGTATWTGAYDSITKAFSITSSVTSSLYGKSGPNPKRSAMVTLGFDRLDYTAATSFTSTYTPNQIARLIEPLKAFNREDQPFIYSTDPIKMQEEYPMSSVGERIPDRFCRIMEDPGGSVWVRFNGFPKDKMKVTADWIPQPIDLQDNSTSYPLLPRPDLDVLINGAAAMIAFDKEDSKWEGLFGLAKNGLEAMRKKNRALLFKTGASFGQITPRADLNYQSRRMRRYGYDADNW